MRRGSYHFSRTIAGYIFLKLTMVIIYVTFVCSLTQRTVGLFHSDKELIERRGSGVGRQTLD